MTSYSESAKAGLTSGPPLSRDEPMTPYNVNQGLKNDKRSAVGKFVECYNYNS